MFMFRNRRQALVKRLWKLRKCSTPNPDDQPNNPTPHGVRHGAPKEEEAAQGLSRRREVAAQSMLKRLKESQLDDLIRTIESKGTCDPRAGACCLVPRGDVRIVGGRALPPRVLLAQLFRWPEVQHTFELKRLPVCEHKGVSGSSSGKGETCDESSELYDCCNPYHWSRLFKPAGSSPLPSGLLDRLGQSTVGISLESAVGQSGINQVPRILLSGPICPNALEDSSTSSEDAVSFSTNGTQQNGLDAITGCRTWCKLAYWEESTRVGRQFPVTSSTVDVFSALPKGNGLCLSSLFGENKKPTESTSKTREKIGQGILLSLDNGESGEPGTGGVWLYNRTDHPIFVNSPTLGPPPTTTTASTTLPSAVYTVYKVPPSYSIQIFDFEKSRVYEKLRDLRTLDGPFDPNSIRISFAKGWGSNYSRQYVTSCPCWLEVMLCVPQPPR